MELKIYNPQEDGFLQSIDWNFEELKEELTEKVKEYLNLVYSDDQIKEAKKDRASLRKFVEALEDKRKEIKKQVLIPYEEFESREKELVSIVNEAIENIGIQVKSYEEGLKKDKLKKVQEIYKECIGDLDRIVPFDKIFNDSWLNVSTTLKSIREEITGLYKKIDSELKIINAETGSYVFEMKEEYLKNYDLSAAMAKKHELLENEKKKVLFEEQRRKEEEEKQKKLEEEATLVQSAGRQDVSVVNTYIDENGNPVPELPKGRVLAITFRVSAHEHNFQEVNKLLSQLQKYCESFDILRKEEL